MFKRTTIVTAAAVLVSGASLAVAGISLAGADEQTQPTSASVESGSTPSAPGYGPGSGWGRGGMGRGGGMHQHTAVTGDELAKVTAAVKAKDSGVSLAWVGKDEDGSYDGRGMKDGSPVMVEVSKDLGNVEIRTAPMGRMGGFNGQPGRGFGPGQQPTPSDDGGDGQEGGASASSASFNV